MGVKASTFMWHSTRWAKTDIQCHDLLVVEDTIGKKIQWSQYRSGGNNALNEVRIQLMAAQYRMKAGAERDDMMNRWGVEIKLKGSGVKKVCWMKPMGEMVKLNSDGSWDGNNGYWVAMIRGNKGQILAMANGKSQYCRIDLIELQGLMFGIKLARRYSYEEKDATTDSTIVKYYLEMEQAPWETRKMVGRI